MQEAIIAVHTGPGRKPRPKPSTDPGPFRSRSLAPIAWIIAVVFAGVALLVYLWLPDERPIKVRGAAVDQPIPAPPALPPPPKPRPRVEPDTPNDVLGRTKDFKAVFTRYRDSQNAIERGLAGRAHRACFPSFMPPRGQAPSPTYAINALPTQNRAERKAAIEELYARCSSFLTQPLEPAEVVGTAERVTNGDLATAGAAARWAMMRGDRTKADETIEQALRAREPYAIHSLSGLSGLMMNETAKGFSPDVTDAALALVACELGAACGPDSLLALQLCATEGRCEGSARERMLERIGSLDMDAVEKERKRLRALFDSGSANLNSVWRPSR